MYQGNFSEYQLVNPIITSFKHGDHDVAVNEFLQTDMTVQYETVKYLEGKVTQNTAGGFIDLHYDTTSSPNGGTSQSRTNTDQITDLANNQTAIMPLMRSDVSLTAASGSPSQAVPPLLNQITYGSSSGGANSGGYSIPSLGSLTQGVTGSAVLGQQLRTAGIGLVGSATSQLATGLTGAVAKGLGSQGSTIVGLAASAIANPNQALKTVENMATALVLGVGMNIVNQAIASGVQSLSSSITGGIQTGLGKLDSTFAFGDKLTQLSESTNNLFNGGGFVTNATLQAQFEAGTGVYGQTTLIGGIETPNSLLNP